MAWYRGCLCDPKGSGYAAVITEQLVQGEAPGVQMFQQLFGAPS